MAYYFRVAYYFEVNWTVVNWTLENEVIFQGTATRENERSQKLVIFASDTGSVLYVIVLI